MLWTRKNQDRECGQAVLEKAIAEWQGSRGGDESLSGHARARIVDESLDPSHDPAAPASLFLPARRLAWAGAIPVLLGLAFTLVLKHAGTSTFEERIMAAKKDGQVVFTVADGGKMHYVRRASTPQEIDRAGCMDATIPGTSRSPTVSFSVSP